jgi:transcriptional regulator with XRE-family HTH domain
MLPTDLKILLLQRGVTVSEIARTIGVHSQAVSQVVHGKRRTPFIRRAIADALRISYRSAWGVEDPGVDRLVPRKPDHVSTVTQSETTQGE